MNTEQQTDATNKLGILASLNYTAVMFLCVAFWCIVGAAVAAFFKDWHAFGWAAVSLALSLYVVQQKRWT